MKKLLLIGAAFAVLLAPAMAADQAVRVHKRPRPVVVAAPVYNWTGCYIGANTGYGWNTGKSSYQDPNTTTDPINGVPFPTGVAQFIPTPSGTNGSRWIGGGEIGCNWQMARWLVLGVEADIDAMHASGSATTVGPTGNYGVSPVAAGSGTGIANEQVSLQWLSTIRARAGLPVLADRGLLFVTGGLAMGRVSSLGSVSLVNTGVLEAEWAGSNSSTQAGWTVGGGFEYALTDHWTTKAEYLYYDLGNASHSLNATFNAFGGSIYPTLGNTVSPVHGNIVRVGLNYKFGNYYAPVVTK